MEDLHGGGALPVAVNPPVALLHAIGVPGDFAVDEPRTVVLEVNALGGRVGRQQNPHGGNRRTGLERRLNPLALVGGHPTVKAQHALATAKPRVGQHLEQPALGVPILGEDEHPRLRPRAFRGEQLRL